MSTQATTRRDRFVKTIFAVETARGGNKLERFQMLNVFNLVLSLRLSWRLTLVECITVPVLLHTLLALLERTKLSLKSFVLSNALAYSKVL